MSFTGTSGCMLMLVASFGMNQTMTNFLDTFYDGTAVYSLKVFMSTDADKYFVKQDEAPARLSYQQVLLWYYIRVNMDLFLDDETPESTWGEYDNYNNKVTEENPETLDIFEPAMHNLFDTASIVIDSILDGTIGE